MAPSNSRLSVWQLTVEELRDQLRRERDRSEDWTKLARIRLTTVNSQRKSLAEKDEQLGQMSEQLAHMNEQFAQAIAEIAQLRIKLATTQQETESIHPSTNPTLSNNRRSSSIGAGFEALNICSPSINPDDEAVPLLPRLVNPSSQSFGELPPSFTFRAPAAPMYAPDLYGSAAPQHRTPYYDQSYEQAHIEVPLQADRSQTSSVDEHMGRRAKRVRTC